MFLITQWSWMKVKPPGMTDPKDLDTKMESSAGLLLLLLSHFSRVRLCATP